MTDFRAAPALAIRGLAKSYGGVRVLGPVDVEIRAGSVHCLLGGNGSGKSTLIRTLAGVVAADPGGVLVRAGRQVPVAALTPGLARRLGMRFVHQDPGVFLDMTVADNLAADAPYPRRWASVDRREVQARAMAALARFGPGVDPRASMGALGAADRTLVAIARALRDDDAAVLVLDEPTASLPATEVDGLLDTLTRLAHEGQAILYVTHHLDEVVTLADECTVLRDGSVVSQMRRPAITRPDLVDAIVGRDASVRTVARPLQPSRATRLRVRGLRGGGIGPIDLDVDAGEIVGLAGLLGSGRSTLLRTLFGAQRRCAGTVRLDDVPLDPTTPAAALRRQVAFVPEDRPGEGAFLDQDIADNLAASILATSRRFHVAPRRVRARSEAAIAHYCIRARSGAGQIMSRLSGGNQQKVVLARSLQSAPRLLLLDEPTQGVDVGARHELHRLIVEHCRGTGAAALVASSADDELATLCDRVLVLRDGRVAAELTDPTPQAITRAVLAGAHPDGEGHPT